MSSRKFAFVFLFLHFGALLQAQIKQEAVPLEQVLDLLEERFPYQFNYAVETLENVYLVAPSENLSLKKTITYLEKETGLKFLILSKKFISIEPRGSLLLCGYIKNESTGNPIVSATIIGAKSSAISDETGYFEIKVNSEEEIKIQHLGYKKNIKPYSFFKKYLCSDIYLTEQIQELSEVVLTNFLTEGINKMSDGSFQIDFTDFGILPGLIESDVLQTIQALPGVQSINETVSNINIRGGTNDQNLLIWDGIKMYQSGHFFGLVSIYNPMITQNARLIKNGSRVDYTDGVSGTIEMETADRVNQKFAGSLGLNFISASGFVDAPIGRRSSIQIAARNSLGNLLQTPTYDSYVNRILQDTQVQDGMENISNSAIEFDFYDASIRWLWDIDDKNRIRVNFITVGNEFDFNESGLLNTVERSQSSNLFQNSLAAGLNYERSWSNLFKTELQLYETDYKLAGINLDRFQNQRFLQENQVSETGLKLNTYYTLGNRLKLLSGYQFTETQITNLDDVDDPLYRLKVSEVVRAHGLYSQLDFTSLKGQTNFSAGVRLNYLDKFDKYLLEPRISFNKKLLKNLTVELLGEYKHQVTSQIINLQNDFLGIEKRRWQLADDNTIPIIKSKQASLGLHLNKNGWLVSGEGYFKFVTGITTQSQGFQNQYEFIKTDGSYEAYGFDFLVRKKLEKFNVWLSYSFMENHYTFKEFLEGSFPNNLEISNAVTLGASYSLNDFKVSAGFNWHTGRPTTRPQLGNETIGQSINYGPANASRLRDYFRVDLSSTYQMKLAKGIKADIGVSLWNTLNRKNIISNYYRINGSGIPVEVFKASLEITPNISCRISF